ncbi:hypothetical protein [Dysgonomonas macrotermitis]|uniref:Phage terminase small subunit n=1 Tax=Dysgonomonas macrotermitis TaxID=1346286 RepID=A0A1M5IWJ6_9BACT|nr:hypothetical protein [Dysgonomonas macrotermitis]SHG32718.1 hypothetical protein SAMN05444362_12142 [Dysgonomonas macrotermitis]
MAKPKYNYKSKEFLDQIESLAKKGLTDKEIAFSMGLNPTYFSEKKEAVPELSEALTRARVQINAIVRQKYLSIGLGGIKTRTVTRRKVEIEDGSLMDGDVIQETETELPPNPSVLAQWLFNHDEEWRKSVIDGKKLDVTSNGETVGVQLVFADTPLSDKDLEEIKNIQNGNSSTEEDSTDSGIQET